MSEGNAPVTLTHSDKCFQIFCWYLCLLPSSPSMSTLFGSVNKHNRHTFRNCIEFIFDITGYSINFRKLAFGGTLLVETDIWIRCIDIFKTSYRRREVKIQRYCIGYIRKFVVARSVWFYEWLVSTIVDMWLVLRAGSLKFCIEGVYFRLRCFDVFCMLKQVTVSYWSAYSSVWVYIETVLCWIIVAIR